MPLIKITVVSLSTLHLAVPTCQAAACSSLNSHLVLEGEFALACVLQMRQCRHRMDCHRSLSVSAEIHIRVWVTPRPALLAIPSVHPPAPPHVRANTCQELSLGLTLPWPLLGSSSDLSYSLSWKRNQAGPCRECFGTWPRLLWELETLFPLLGMMPSKSSHRLSSRNCLCRWLLRGLATSLPMSACIKPRGFQVPVSWISLLPGGPDCLQSPASQGLLGLTTSTRTRVLCGAT